MGVPSFDEIDKATGSKADLDDGDGVFVVVIVVVAVIVFGDEVADFNGMVTSPLIEGDEGEQEEEKATFEDKEARLRLPEK